MRPFDVMTPGILAIIGAMVGLAFGFIFITGKLIFQLGSTIYTACKERKE